jgi:hypothetical protein
MASKDAKRKQKVAMERKAQEGLEATRDQLTL